MKKNTLLIFLFLLGITAFGQKVTTSIDTTRNKIGAQFNLTLRTTVDTTAKVVFPSGTTFGKLDVIRDYVIDTVIKDSQYELIKKYGLTQFDSGKYVLPRLPILINNQRVFSDSLLLEISNVKVDTLTQKMYDIKPVIEAESSIGSWWKYFLIFLLIIGIGVAIYLLIKKYQKKKLDQEIYKTPIEKATSLLKNLENKQLWQRGEIKTYYSELTDIARIYIEEEIHIPAMESTTSELITALRNVANQKKMKLSKETLLDLEKVLKQADLVKFAKSQPLEFEINEDKKRIENSIVLIHKAVPEVVIEEGDNALDELLKEKLLKKKRTQRILISVASVLVLFFGTIIFLIATKGFDYVKDNFIGHPTKDLLEGEWVSSEYGNPGVFIETPKVLKRIDLKSQMPKEGMALIKDMQSFAYGSILDNFYIMVSTFKYKQEVDIDLGKTLENSVQLLEAGGATNMILKQEDYSTKMGVEGKKGYGTATLINAATKTSEKIYYEIIVFKQDGGLQQLLVLHNETDKYAKELTTRMLNSVELKKAGE